MAIFEHKGVWRDKMFLDIAWQTIKNRAICIYCKEISILRILHAANRAWEKGDSYFERYDMVSCCDRCGWWFAQRKLYETVHGEVWSTVQGAAGNLYPFDKFTDDESVETARLELLKNWENSKGVINPRKLEEVATNVFRNYGYQACTTAYSNDGGIDVVLEHQGKKHGVQVKRYKNNIKVGEIRAFAGALLLNGLPSGVFVTTSDYQRGCHNTADLYKVLGMPIELVNGQKFLEALEINRREPYENWTELFGGNPETLPEIVSTMVC